MFGTLNADSRCQSALSCKHWLSMCDTAYWGEQIFAFRPAQGSQQPPATIATLCAQLFSQRAAQLLFVNQRLQRWCFDVELIYLAQRLGIPIAETSVNWTEVPGDNFTYPGVMCICMRCPMDSACHVPSASCIALTRSSCLTW